MSGCCWLPLTKPITGRPVAVSITASKRSRISSWNSTRCWMTAGPRPPASSVASTLEKPPRGTHTTRSSWIVGLCPGWPVTVELLRQRNEAVGDCRESIAVRAACGPNVSGAHCRPRCPPVGRSQRRAPPLRSSGLVRCSGRPSWAALAGGSDYPGADRPGYLEGEGEGTPTAVMSANAGAWTWSPSRRAESHEWCAPVHLRVRLRKPQSRPVVRSEGRQH
jgi:hypothetical protein